MKIDMPNNSSMICFYAQMFFHQTIDYAKAHHIHSYAGLIDRLTKDPEYRYLVNYIQETFPDQVHTYFGETA